MKFNNAIAYCKGFYKPRGDANEQWKDLSHCIQVDGWMCHTKKEVANWCIARMEDFAREFPQDAWKVSFGTIFRDMQDKKRLWECFCDNGQLEDMDYVIWAFRDFIRYNTNGDMFTSGVIPNNLVLPLNDYIGEALWRDIVSKYEEQSENQPFWISYEEREKNINKRRCITSIKPIE